MSKTKSSSIRSVGTELDTLVNSLGIKNKLQEYDAVVYWETAVGKQISKIATATKITKGILIVHVKTSTWRNELTLRKKEIMDKLNNAVGMNIVKNIKFQ